MVAQRDREKEGGESRGYLHAAPIRLKVVTAAATAKDPRHTQRAVRAPATHIGGGAEEQHLAQRVDPSTGRHRAQFRGYVVLTASFPHVDASRARR